MAARARAACRFGLCVEIGCRWEAALAGFEEDAALFGAVWGWRCEGPGHWCEPPFFYVGFDEDEAELAEVDVDCAGAVGAEGREEVEGFEPVDDVFEFFAVAREEDGTGARAVANADDVALDVGGAVWGGVEGLVVAAPAGGCVCDRVLVVACGTLDSSEHRGAGRVGTGEAEHGVGFGAHADGHEGGVGFIVDLGFPVVHFVLFWDGEVALDRALGVKEFNFCPLLDKAVCDLELCFKLPG